ncbi:MAG: hypothetical protein WDZ58_02145, partial [Gemmatimonadaceae bacterium]
TALEKLPADRFATAAEFSAAINTPGAHVFSARERTTAHAPVAASWPRMALAVGVVAVLASALGFAAARMTARDGDAPPIVGRFVIATPDDHRLAGTGWTTVAIAPDARTLVYVGNNASGLQLYRRRFDELVPTAIPGTEGAQNALISPNGMWIGFTTGTGLRKIPISGGASVPLSTGPLFPQGGVWLDNETMAISALDGAVYAVGGDGTNRLVAGPDSSAGEATLIVTDAVDDGRAVIVIAATGASVNGKAFLIDVKSGKRKLVVDQIVSGAAYDDGYVAWVTPDGTLMGAAYDPGGSDPAGSPATLAQQVRLSVGGPPQFSVSRNGSLVYVPQLPFELMLVDRSGQAVRAADVQRRFHSPRFSPDGSRIAVDFTLQDSRDVWTLNVAERTLTRLTFDNDGHDAVWSPDGRRVGYAS